MAEVVVIGAGLSGTLMAYELLPQLRKDDRLTVVSQGAVYHFVPSNPWVAIGWRKQSEIEIDLYVFRFAPSDRDPWVRRHNVIAWSLTDHRQAILRS